jgi:hypothetical protein
MNFSRNVIFNMNDNSANDIIMTPIILVPQERTQEKLQSAKYNNILNIEILY